MECCKTFDKLAWIYNPFVKLFRKPEEYYEKIKSVAKLKKSDSILDVGGGTGLIAECFLNDVKKIVVMDPSKNMLGKIKEKKIERMFGIAQEIRFKSKTFDLVYCVDSFHHFTNGYAKEDYAKTIDVCVKELLRVLKNDGALVIIDFDPQKFSGKLVDFFENKIMHLGSNFYSPKGLEKLFKKYHANVKTFDLDKWCYLAKITKG